MTRRTAARAGVLAVVVTCVAVTRAAQAPADPAAWTSFEGAWSASGHRQAVAIDASRAAVAVELSGPVVLSKTDGISRGFRGAAVGFDDGEGVSVIRAVWTDEHGDRLFSRLRGDAVDRGRRFVGTFTGGTGRYAGATGEYAFTWQYVIQADDGTIQGRTVGLSGRVRRAGAQP